MWSNNVEYADLDYTTSASAIASTVEYLTGVRPVTWTSGDYEDGFIHYFLFSGYPKDLDVPQFAVA
jgi:hypothetical protein